MLIACKLISPLAVFHAACFTYSCYNKTCLDESLVCDGKRDCQYGEDENYCVDGETEAHFVVYNNRYYIPEKYLRYFKTIYKANTHNHDCTLLLKSHGGLFAI